MGKKDVRLVGIENQVDINKDTFFRPYGECTEQNIF